MAERRTLVAGLKATPPVNPSLEKDFVYGDKSRSISTQTASSAISKAPISTRIRADFAHTLKRASLERQLQGIEPHTLQEIIEEALEPWLRSHGYLTDAN